MSFDLDPLEPRRLCSITWANRGNDNFPRFYGKSATLARQLVNAALPKANLKVRISAADLEPGSKSPNRLGQTSGASIAMDSNAAGRKWYFDPDLNDDADVVARNAQTDGLEHTPPDFYTAVLHELGHALGFRDTKNPARIYFNEYQSVTDPTHAAEGPTLMAPFVVARFRAYVTSYEATHTRFAKAGLGNPARGAYFSVDSYQGQARISRPDGVLDTVAVYRTRPDQPDAPPVPVATFVPGTAYPVYDTGALAGVTYRYSAVVTRTLSTPRRHTISFTPPNSQTFTLTPGARVAETPSSLIGLGAPGLSVVTWTPYPGADHYDIYRTTYSIDDHGFSVDHPPAPSQLASDLAIGHAHLVGSVPPSETTFADPRPDDAPVSVKARNAYRYWVVASLPTGPYVYPVSAVGFANNHFFVAGNASPEIAAGKPTLQWTAPTLLFLDHYEIWRSSDTATTDRVAAGAAPIATLSATATSFTDPTATPGTPYRYWIVYLAHVITFPYPTATSPLLPFPTLDSTLSYTQPPA